MAYKSDTEDDTKNNTAISFKRCRARSSTTFAKWLNATGDEKKALQCNGVLLADCDYSEISDCIAEDMSFFGIELKNHSRWNKVTNCRASNCNYGFGMGQQTEGDIGCEHNLISGFLADNCFMGAMTGKSKYNNLTDFIVDFTQREPLEVIQACRFQLGARFNTINNMIVSGLPEKKRLYVMKEVQIIIQVSFPYASRVK